MSPGDSGLDGDAGPEADSGEVGAPDASQELGDVGVYEGPAIVYGASADTLYQLDPTHKSVTVIGVFVGCANVIDLALDKDSTIWATTWDGLYKIDPTNAYCSRVAKGTYPNSLSFVPVGTVDPYSEALVGYDESTYVRISTVTGAITRIGELTGGFASSGDIVSVKNGGTYLTVKGPSCNDCLFKIDPKTGDMVENLGPIHFTDVFGLAYWAGKVYGFTAGGALFEVSLEKNLPTVKIPVPNATASQAFWGAGSTTSAPVGASQ
ncbi:MAG: hypothetical protein QM765_12035 [Myxococcales bacterium]